MRTTIDVQGPRGHPLDESPLSSAAGPLTPFFLLSCFDLLRPVVEGANASWTLLGFHFRKAAYLHTASSQKKRQWCFSVEMRQFYVCGPPSEPTILPLQYWHALARNFVNANAESIFHTPLSVGNFGNSRMPRSSSRANSRSYQCWQTRSVYSACGTSLLNRMPNRTGEASLF